MKTNYKEGSFEQFAMGRAYKEHQREMIPCGDKIINAARSAIWEAWEIGLQKGGDSFYPTLPLLDRQPIEPEI